MNEKDETKSLDVEKKQSYEDKMCSSSEISEEESKISESSSECKCDVEHDNDDDNGEMEACHQKVIVTETSLIRKKVPDFKFYEKQLQEKKEHEKKYEIIRKKREEDFKNRAKPVINEESKKIMEKKQGFVKPIFQRAKEIEATKKHKIETIKKNIEEKKAKQDEDEILKNKFMMKNKKNLHAFNDKEFEDWRNIQIEWENQKQKKIENIKEQHQRKRLESISKMYHPIIDKKSVNIANKTNSRDQKTNVFQKLYNLNEEKQKKQLQKVIEALPQFKPSINKKLPQYIRNKNISSSYHSCDYRSEKLNTTTRSVNNRHNFSIDFPSSSKSEIRSYYNHYTQSGETQKTKAINGSTIETNNNQIILSRSSDEEDDYHDHNDVVLNYKKALEMNDHTPVKPTLLEYMTNIETLNGSVTNKITNTKSDNNNKNKLKVISNQTPKTQISKDLNKQKIELCNKKIQELLLSLKNAKKKK